MINSRDLNELLPIVQHKAVCFVAACKSAGIDVLITSTYRDHESQDALYAQGRTKPGRVVTNARGGQSFHNFRVAFDFVPMRHGKPQWDDDALLLSCGVIGEACGLEWAGRWQAFAERLHMQYAGGLSLADLRAGKRPEGRAA